MRKRLKNTVKATIKTIIVALLIAIGLLLCLFIIFDEEIKWAISSIDLISVNKKNYEQVKTTMDEETKKIKNYPEYGTEYANIKIEKIDVDLPVFFGDDLKTLKKGVRTL